MSKLSKAKANNIHAARRAKERYGLDYDKNTRKEIINLILKGKARFIKKESNTRTQFIVKHNGQLYHVVYCKTNHNIITFLTMEMKYLEEEFY